MDFFSKNHAEREVSIGYWVSGLLYSKAKVLLTHIPNEVGNAALLPTSVAIPALILKPKLPGFHQRQETQVLRCPPITSPVLPPGL